MFDIFHFHKEFIYPFMLYKSFFFSIITKHSLTSLLLMSSGLKWLMYLSKSWYLIVLEERLHIFMYYLSFSTFLLKSWVTAWIFLWSWTLDSSKINRFSLNDYCVIEKNLSKVTIFSLTLFSLLFFLHLNIAPYMSVNLHLTIRLAALSFLNLP